MIIKTIGSSKKPVILFFHAMGVNGDSSLRVAEHLKDEYYCIMPTATIYCEGQEYKSKDDEVNQVRQYLQAHHINHIQLLVASSIGADLAMAFLTQTKYKIDHIYFDGGQFAQIRKGVRKLMTPFLYLAMKSLAWSNGDTLKYILWCDDEDIKPYFVKATTNLKYRNLYHFLLDSLIDEPFYNVDPSLQQKMIFAFGSKEDHFKYRDAVKKAYPYASYPIFDGYNHMQYQIQDPLGFANMLKHIIIYNELSKEAKVLLK